MTLARLLLSAWLACVVFSPNSMENNAEQERDWPIWQVDVASCNLAKS